MTDTSFGIIPIKLVYNQHTGEQAPHFLLVHHQKGHWAFPKGHAEPGEMPLETAQRELFEETGLTVTIPKPNSTFLERYSFTNKKGQNIDKTVTFFWGFAETNARITLQQAEVQAAAWFEPSQVPEQLTFPASRQLFDQVWTQLQQIDLSNLT